jgi:hypothetical protein
MLHEDDPSPPETLQQVTLNAIDSNTDWCKNVTVNTTVQLCAGIMPNGGKGESLYNVSLIVVRIDSETISQYCFC